METTIRNHMNPHEALGSLEHVISKEYRNREKHVDPNGFFEVWENNGVRETYERVFGESIRKYNEKQKRKDRRIMDENGDEINGYIESILKDKRGRYIKSVVSKPAKDETGKYPVYVTDENGKNKQVFESHEIETKNPRSEGRRVLFELVISAGNVDKAVDEKGRIMYTPDGHEVHPMAIPDEVNYKSVRRFCAGFERMFPRLAIVATGYHGDEVYTNGRGIYEKGTGHGHIEFVPFADGYKRGMDTQANIYRALEQMGYHAGKDETGKTRSQYYFFTQDVQRKFEDILQKEWARYRKEKGLQPEELKIVHPDKGTDRKNMSREEYAEAQQNRADAVMAKYAKKAFEEQAEESREKAEREEIRRENAKKEADDMDNVGAGLLFEIDDLQEQKEKEQKEIDELRELKQREREEISSLREERQTLQEQNAEVYKIHTEARRIYTETGGALQAVKSLLNELEGLKNDFTASQRARLDGLKHTETETEERFRHLSERLESNGAFLGYTEDETDLTGLTR